MSRCDCPVWTICSVSMEAMVLAVTTCVFGHLSIHDSPASMTPPGEDAPAAGTHRALKQDEATTTQDLLQAVLSSDNLARAWKRVKANKGAPGIDGVTVEAWHIHAREHWQGLREQIERGRYRPQEVRRVEMPKPAGGKRMLGIPTITDRVG